MVGGSQSGSGRFTLVTWVLCGSRGARSALAFCAVHTVVGKKIEPKAAALIRSRRPSDAALLASGERPCVLALSPDEEQMGGKIVRGSGSDVNVSEKDSSVSVPTEGNFSNFTSS